MASADSGMTGALEHIKQRHPNDATPQGARDEALGLLLARNNMTGNHELSKADKDTMSKYGLPSAEQLLGTAAALKPGPDAVPIPGQNGLMISEGAPDKLGRPVSIVYDASDPKHLSTTYVDSQGNAQSFIAGKDGHGVTVIGRDGKPKNYGDGSSIDIDPKTGCPKVGPDGIPVIKTNDNREIKVNADGTSESKDSNNIVTTADDTGHIKSIKFSNGSVANITPEASKALTPVEGKPGHFSFNGQEIQQLATTPEGGLTFRDRQGRTIGINKIGVESITQRGDNAPTEYWSADHQYSICQREGRWYAHRENSSEFPEVSAPSLDPSTGVLTAMRHDAAAYVIGGDNKPAQGTNGWVTESPFT